MPMDRSWYRLTNLSMRAEGWKGDWVAQSSPMRSEWSEEAETTVQGWSELSASFQDKVGKIRRGAQSLLIKSSLGENLTSFTVPLCPCSL